MCARVIRVRGVKGWVRGARHRHRRPKEWYTYQDNNALLFVPPKQPAVHEFVTKNGGLFKKYILSTVACYS